MPNYRPLLAAILAATLWSPAHATVARSGEPAGSVLTTQGDEQIRFLDQGPWAAVEREQALLGGDHLRTGPYGALALLFADRTQVRVQRNSSLLVKQVSGPGPAQLRLDRGGAWSRAATHGKGLEIQTPSATAAIRGTEWSLAVNDQGRSTLVVIAGEIELSNEFGAVRVGPGEVGTAEVGRAPQKNVLVQPELRAQFALHLDVRYALPLLPASDIKGPQLESRQAALQALTSDQRSVAQWAELAAIEIDLGHYSEARRALAHLPSDHPDRPYLAGYLAATDGHFAIAAELLGRTLQQGPAQRRTTARIAYYWSLFALGQFREADALRSELAATEGPYPALAIAWTLAFQGELPTAATQLDQALVRYPNHPALTILAANIAILLGRTEQADRLSQQAIKAAPDSALAWVVRGQYLDGFTPQRDETLTTYRRAVALAPENAIAQNNLGLALYDQDYPIAAEERLRYAMELAPQDPIPPLNLAILLLDRHRIDEATALVERFADQGALSYLVEGRIAAQRGELETAIDRLLAATTAAPLLANAESGAAIVYHELGEGARAEQALANADRLDPHDPLPPLISSIIAIDDYRADHAINGAREALRRIRQRDGEDLGQLAASRSGAISVGSALGNVGLLDWADFYNDLAYSPFDANSNFVRAHREVGGLGYLTTGFTLDPLAIYRRHRYTDLFYRPFTDLTLAGGYATDADRDWQRKEGSIALSGFDNSALPVAYDLSLSSSRQRDLAGPAEGPAGASVATAALGTQLGQRLSLNLFYNGERNYQGNSLDAILRSEEENRDREWVVGMGYKLGDRDMLMGVVTRSYQQSFADWRHGTLRYAKETELDAPTVGLRRLTQLGETTVGIGVERAEGEVKQYERLEKFFDRDAIDVTSTRADLDLLWQPHPSVDLQGAVSLARFETRGTDERYVAPRLGIAWRPSQDQMVRLAYRQDPPTVVIYSLTPPDTVGLIPYQRSIVLDIESWLARWDKEWNQRLFTAVSAQRLRAEDPTRADPPMEATRLGAAGNLWLGDGVGLAASYYHVDSEWRGGDLAGQPLPWQPEYNGSIGLSWVHPAYVRIDLAWETIGPQRNDEQQALNGYDLLNLTTRWEPLNKHLMLGVKVDNLLDQRHTADALYPDEGRAYYLFGEVRF